MAYRQVRKDEISRGTGSVKIGHTSYWRTGQDGECRGCRRHAAFGHGACIFKRCEEEEVGIVLEGDVGFCVALALEDFEFDDRRWIDWAPVC